MELVKILKALSDETRLRILNLLIKEELCVCEIECLLRINQSNASRHLEKLRNVGLITYEKKAQWVYYKVNEEMMSKYPFTYELLSAELNKIEKFKIDSQKLIEHKDSGVTCDDLDSPCCNTSE